MTKSRKAQSSKRNRHTGHINAFKQHIMEHGQMFKNKGKIYFKKWIGSNNSSNSITIVRMK